MKTIEKASFADFQQRFRSCERIQLPNEENVNTLNYSLSPDSDFGKDFAYLSMTEFGIVPKEVINKHKVFRQSRKMGSKELRKFYLIDRAIVKPYLSKRPNK